MKVRITWSDPNFGESGHKVYRSTSPMDPQNLPTALASLGPEVTAYDDASVVDQTTYYYRVSALFGAEEQVSEEIEVFAGSSAVIPSAGLVLYMPMTNMTTLIVQDESGSTTPHDGTPGAGVTQVAGGVDGPGADFDGTSTAWVDIPHHADFESQDYSISLWVKAAALSSDSQGLLYKAPDTGFNRQMGLIIDDLDNGGQFVASMSNGSQMWQLYSTTVADGQEFIHVAFTQEGLVGKLYINGVVEASQTITGTPLTNTEKITLGRVSSSSKVTRHLNGVMDSLRLYTRGLTQQEVQNLYYEHSGLPTLQAPTNVSVTPV